MCSIMCGGGQVSRGSRIAVLGRHQLPKTPKPQNPLSKAKYWKIFIQNWCYGMLHYFSQNLFVSACCYIKLKFLDNIKLTAYLYLDVIDAIVVKFTDFSYDLCEGGGERLAIFWSKFKLHYEIPYILIHTLIQYFSYIIIIPTVYKFILSRII